MMEGTVGVGRCQTTAITLTVQAYILIVSSLLLSIALCVVTYLFCKKRKLNALLFGYKKKRKDGEKKPVDLTEYMDDTFEPGLDDDLDITLNPVMIHRMEQMRKAAKKKGPRTPGMGKTGGLARLNLGNFDGPKGGQSHAAKNMDKYLGQLGIDSAEGGDRKQPAKGSAEYKKAQKSMAAVKALQHSGESQTSARAGARQAIQAAMQNRQSEFDQPIVESPTLTSRRSNVDLSAPSSRSIQMDL